MINVEAAVTGKYPRFANTPALIRSAAFSLLRKILHEDEINSFLQEYPELSGFAWIDKVFEFLNFSYSVSARDRSHIPATGRVVIIANHPIGSLDGLALLRLVGEVRRDVLIIANDMLSQFQPLQNLILPVDNMTGGNVMRTYRRVLEELEQERAIVVFPAGEVSRAGPSGVKDGPWRPGFLHFARKTKAPVLPIHVKARNSLLFYGASLLFKPMSTLLLSNEMFKHQTKVIHFNVGKLIPVQHLQSTELHDRTLVKRLQRHLYKLHKPDVNAFVTERTVAHPEPRQLLQQELRKASLLGVTRDNNAIYLLDWSRDSAVIREIGRLRELTFRMVGEGTGKTRDLDTYDCYYRHLVLWDREALEIAGAYRLGEGKALLEKAGINGFYTNTLFRYDPSITHYLSQGLELGRSFVSPAYWGKASLDYLWQGLGAYLYHHPDIRYVFGPVSMSATYPRALTEELVYYFSTYYGCPQKLATARHPFQIRPEQVTRLNQRYANLDRQQGMTLLQSAFQENGLKIPVLFKQYAALFEDGGFQTLVFSSDPDFADCLDGLCMADLSLLRATRRERYVAARHGSDH